MSNYLVYTVPTDGPVALAAKTFADTRVTKGHLILHYILILDCLI